eukprot:Opistho-2@17566
MGMEMRAMVALSFMGSIGVLFVILACVLYHNTFWPMFVALPYVLAPIPNCIARRASRDSFSLSTSNPGLDFGNFFTSVFFVSGFAIPMVLAHAGKIAVGAMMLTLAGSLVIFATMILFNRLSHSDDW